MAPDIEELIKRVNTLTLDKNRLKQKLSQLINSHPNGKDLIGRGSLAKLSSSSLDSGGCVETPGTQGDNNNISGQSPNNRANLVAGVDCSTSCEEDILYINELYRKRLDEYDQNWEMIQSRCSALLSELTALQKHFMLVKRENHELEEKLMSQCDENEKIRGELQTVVLNYESQLSAMSEHLSSVTHQLSLEDENPSNRSIRNPNYID